MERQDSYLPPAEVVSTGEYPEHVPPPGFVDYWDWTKIKDDLLGVRTGRLEPWLREAAATRDPREILRKAVVARLQPTTDDATAESQALADLSVSGRGSFAAFTAAPIRDDELLVLARPALVGIAEPQIRDAVRNVLDRAYTVAWALRGSPSQRAALRPRLGWIALSGEDDPPHAPTNFPASRDDMGEFTMRIGQSGQPVTLRATLMLPAAPEPDPVPDITLRAIPAPTAFAEALSDRIAAGYDELLLFVHGLGSLAEESDTFKRLVVDLGAARGRRYAVLSVDLPGVGYSERIDIDALVAQRAKGHHGFALPDGVGSNFPLLGLYRDALIEICNAVRGGVQYVMGGSLGGNMTLWLAAAPMFTDLAPWRSEPSSVRGFCSWSPASIWESYERSRLGPEWGNGTHVDVGKFFATQRARERMDEAETKIRRRQFFRLMQLGEPLPIIPIPTRSAWGHPPTKANLLLQSELYGEFYRRVFWTAAYEQVTFSHQEPLSPSGQWPFKTIHTPLLLASGDLDVGKSGVADIYNQVVFVTNAVPDVPGRRLLMQETNHSIADERPRHLAERILDFLPPPMRTDISYLAPLLLGAEA